MSISFMTNTDLYRDYWVFPLFTAGARTAISDEKREINKKRTKATYDIEVSHRKKMIM